MAGGRGQGWRGEERGRSTRGLNKRLNIPSINFKRCKISANSMVGGGCHSFLCGWPSLSLPSASYPALHPAGNPESSLKLRGIIGSAVSPGGSARSRNDGSLFIVPGRRADSPSLLASQPSNQATNQPSSTRVLSFVARCCLPKSLLTGVPSRERVGWR